jgi:hypothetical protein
LLVEKSSVRRTLAATEGPPVLGVLGTVPRCEPAAEGDAEAG